MERTGCWVSTAGIDAASLLSSYSAAILQSAPTIIGVLSEVSLSHIMASSKSLKSLSSLHLAIEIPISEPVMNEDEVALLVEPKDARLPRSLCWVWHVVVDELFIWCIWVVDFRLIASHSVSWLAKLNLKELRRPLRLQADSLEGGSVHRLLFSL